MARRGGRDDATLHRGFTALSEVVLDHGEVLRAQSAWVHALANAIAFQRGQIQDLLHRLAALEVMIREPHDA